MTDQQRTTSILEQLKRGDDAILVQLYLEVKPEFIAWSGKEYALSEAEATELFQLSMVIFYDNVMTGKLRSLTTQVKTYVFAIAKNKARELLRKKKKHIPLTDLVREIAVEDDIDEKREKEQKIDTVRQHINRLGEKCRTLLRLFYYKSLDMADIARLLNYSSPGTAKNMKYKCLQQLKKMIHQP